MRFNNLLLTSAFAALIACNSTAQQKETLLIGPGDLVQVKVFDTPELDQSIRVTDAGTIPLIVGGGVPVASQTPEAAARKIESVLLDGHFLLHPHVSVSIAEYATQKVSVLGEVKAPGAYAINTPRSVLDVLSLAGGLSDVADRKVLIERRGTKQQVPYFVSNKPNEALDSTVQVNPGDSILVPRAGIVYVLGDVARPGGYTMTNNDAQLTVLQLIARAGGTNHSAVPSRAKLIHKSGNAYTESLLPLSAMQKGKQADLPLQADDIIYIPFSYLRNFGMQASGIAASVGSAAVYRF
ncbi:MAG TPA: polysaccharide biosynthesis/export family protein [Terracidiphilus sp.]|jgi:polysaccharide export outer membrane protein